MTGPADDRVPDIGDDASMVFVGASDTWHAVAPQRPLVSSSCGGRIGRDCVQQAVGLAGWQGVVLPYTRLFARQGFPVVQWHDGVVDRVRNGPGPVLDRPALSLWELWPSGVASSPPPSPLRVVGFVSIATWRPAFQAAHALRGIGSTMLLTSERPSSLRLCDADASGMHVVQHDPDGRCTLLVRGRSGPVDTACRIVASRYWEERLFAHALATGVTDGMPGAAALAPIG